MIQTQKVTQARSAVPHEQIMVVERSALFGKEEFQGIMTHHLEQYLERIKNNYTFLPRPAMEADPTYKQIIPYMIFTHNNRYFLMQRASKPGEMRLRNKYTLGIGGHIRQEDAHEGDITLWARREFHEEINYQDPCTIEFIGLLNDDSNEVGQVHVGLLMLIKGTTDAICIKSELKSGALVTLDECTLQYEALESWSQYVVKYLEAC